jgi:homoserine/homoserine lactone efflux protein
MELSTWLAYFVTTIVLSITPGPGVFSCLSSGLNHGLRVGFWNSIGMQAANLIIVIAVSLGLGALLIASESLFAAVKWLGVVYLIYLGIATWRAVPRRFEDNADDGARTPGEALMRGFFVNATNPKGIIFFAAILPQFIDVARAQLPQYAIFAATTFAVDVVIMTGYAALAARVLGAMREPRHVRWVNRGIGGAFVTAGVALASWRRAASIAAS